MRIALIAPFALHPKGTTRWRVLPLARALAAQGHAVRVVIPPYDWPAHSGRAWQEGRAQVVNVTLPARSTAASHALLAGRVAQAVRAWQPDVVHAFKPKGYSGLAAWALLGMAPAAGARRAPVVVDADDDEAGWSRVLRYPVLWARFFAWQERWLLRRASAVTAASRYLEALAAACGQQVCFYLPNGVEVSCSQNAMPQQRALLFADSPTRLRVLLYTRFVEHSPQEVWRVWQHIVAAVPGARLLVAGQGASGEEAALARLAAEGGAGPSVQALRWLPAATRPGLFAAADVAMLPVADTPLNRAKSPVRLLDLLAAGLPVATQRVGEYAELVQDGVTGLVTAPGDPVALASAVVLLLRDSDLRGRLGQAALQDVCRRRAWPALAAVALAAYCAAGCQAAQPCG